MALTPTALVYVVQDDRVLLMHRLKEPNLGLWTAPGGRIEVDESPHDAACREMHEETGLIVDELVWRGLCTAVSPLPDWQWMLFIYVARSFHGSLQEETREGSLAWVDVDTYLSEMAIPQADRIFAPRVLGPEPDIFEAKFVLDAQLKLVSWVEY